MKFINSCRPNRASEGRNPSSPGNLTAALFYKRPDLLQDTLTLRRHELSFPHNTSRKSIIVQKTVTSVGISTVLVCSPWTSSCDGNQKYP
jgi:hypothetical protein